MLGITELKTGTTIQLDGAPYVVTWNQHSKQARGGGVMKTKLRNLITGGMLERTFQGNDKIEPADVGYSRSQYLYGNGGQYEFMDQTSFETFALSADQLGDAVNFLVDGMEIDVQYFDGNPIGVKLQPKLSFEVTQTDPGVKGDTAQGSGSKPATLETGYEVKVPLFINKGERIVVNTDTGEYVERAKD